MLNRFRGDLDLLGARPERLTEMTAMPCAGVVPMLHHELPDEEGATVRADPGGGALRVAIARFPYGSNLDELHLLGRAARVTFAEHQATWGAPTSSCCPVPRTSSPTWRGCGPAGWPT